MSKDIVQIGTVLIQRTDIHYITQLDNHTGVKVLHRFGEALITLGDDVQAEIAKEDIKTRDKILVNILFRVQQDLNDGRAAIVTSTLDDMYRDYIINLVMNKEKGQ